MKNVFIFSLVSLLFCVISFAQNQSSYERRDFNTWNQEKRTSKESFKKEVLKRVEKIRSAYGVDIYYDQDSLVDAKGNRISGQLISLDKTLRTVHVIEIFLKAYPLDFVQRNIGDIFLYEGLQFNDQSVGGLSGSVGNLIKRGIIVDLANSYENDPSCIKDDFTDTEFILRTLHHELAHNMLVRYKNKFPLKEWVEANGEDFKYHGSAFEYMKTMGREKCLESNDEIHSRGFIKVYSQANIDEDVATMAEAFYTTPQQLSEWMSSYPRLARKVELFDQFYQSIGAK